MVTKTSSKRHEKIEKKERELIHFKNLVESADSAIITRNLDDYITSWNKAAEELFGYSAQEAIGKHFSILVPKNNKHELKRLASLIKKGVRIEDYETVRVKKSGQAFPVAAKISPLIDETGRVTGITVFDRDNTDKKKQKEKRKGTVLGESPKDFIINT